MKKQIPPSVFFTILTIFVVFVGYLLYKQATDPIYHHEPTDEDAIKQFSKGPSASPPVAPKRTEAPKPGGAAKTGSALEGGKSGPAKNAPANPKTAPTNETPKSDTPKSETPESDASSK
jgi:hypothetical protein